VTAVAGEAGSLGSVHLIGIGGAGMSGLAFILLARGAPVSGSDARDSRTVAALRALGARVDVGHRAEQVGSADTVVISTAIRPDNPEVLEARRRGLPVLARAALLTQLMAGYRGVAVAGTHGKTTTTSMLTRALQHCGVDPSFAIGGDLNEAGSNAHHGTGNLFVAEADESDGSFLLLSPSLAVVTNVEPDHLDHYADDAAVVRAFEDFAARLPDGGVLVVCVDDPGSAALAERVRAEDRLSLLTYGESEGADVRLVDVDLSGTGVTFRAVTRGGDVGPLRMTVPGRHNALNAVAALAAGLALGLSAECLGEGLEGYTGVRRRFEPKGSANGVRVYDDYAHHPTELRATLGAARQVAQGGRLVVAFQPHRYSRTAAFRVELAEALGLADEVVVMEVYGAGEDPVPGASGASVAAAVPLPPERVAFQPSFSAVAGDVARRASPGDVVLTLGAGDVTMLGDEVLDALAEIA
jgi:UDP-N-acetylmuramate--alanine ligase